MGENLSSKETGQAVGLNHVTSGKRAKAGGGI